MISYNFKDGQLDKYLDELLGNSREGLTIKKVRGDRPTIISRRLLSRTTEITDVGIFSQENRQKFRAFLYLKRSRVDSFGLPKRHYFVCDKVKEGLPWVLSNQDQVSITCSETQERHEGVQLQLCGYCIKKFQDLTAHRFTGQSFDDFILEMENHDTTRNTTAGIDGYVTNWNEISTAYRRKKDFTCERCGIKDEEGIYMHTHHRNGNKSDNRIDNLECLCIVCHANVDDRHRENFSTITQQRLINKFKDKHRRN